MAHHSAVENAQFAALKAAFDACDHLRYVRGSDRNPKLVDGLYYEVRNPRRSWVLSIYRNDISPGNDVEIAISPSRLASPQGETSLVVRWLQEQRHRLQHSEPNVHTRQAIDEVIHIGLKFDAAILFAEALRHEMRMELDRWGTGVHRIAICMMGTVKATCAQSGSQSVVIAKNKEWRFRNDQHFLEIVTDLLDRSEGRCALSNVRLDTTGQRPELSPSLDRIRSDGHYEPGNLQVVARFVNRWKSDMTDTEFLELLAMVRNP